MFVFVPVLILSSLLLASAGRSAMLGEFSADCVKTMGGNVIKSKLYIKIDKIRTEIAEGDALNVTILRLDKGAIWTLLPNNQYMEVKFDLLQNPSLAPEEAAKLADIKNIGVENIAGYPCDVTQYVYKEKKYGVMTQWISQKLKYPLKMKLEQNGKVTMAEELSNIKEEKLADALFELPAGCKKFGIPGIKLPF
ncbi:MAG: DUF4412 domain-containing protein [Bacillota bacterium]